MNTKSYDCKASLAKPEEVREILAFYEQYRTPAVYLRKEEDIRKSVENELFLIVRNNNNEIIAASGVYILGGGQSICFIASNGGPPRYGVVAELGSVLRREDGLPKEKAVKGIWHPFLFSIPMILLAQKAGNGPDQIPVDFLAADVQITERTTRKRLTGDPTTPLTPLRWSLIDHEGDGLLQAFETSIDPNDSNVHNAKDFFSASIANLPRIAAYLRKSIREGFKNARGESIKIDISDLIDKWTLEFDHSGKRTTVLDRMVANRTMLESQVFAPWRNLDHLFTTVALRRGNPLNVANGNYHGASPATLVSNGAPSRPPIGRIHGPTPDGIQTHDVA
jgi:hypothetical protein